MKKEEIEKHYLSSENLYAGFNVAEVYEKTEKCQHNWIWYPNETSTWKWAGYWKCNKCGLFRI